MFLDDHGGLECRCCGNPADQFWLKLFKEMACTGQSTIQTGNELDYVLVSASLSSLVQQRVE